jgi:hypothetical protein
MVYSWSISDNSKFDRRKGICLSPICRTTSGQQQQDLRLAFHDSSVELICIRLRLFDCQNIGMKKYSISRALINVAANFSLQTSGYFT